MKHFMTSIPLVFIFFIGEANAQCSHLECWEESFPYLFCNPINGHEYIRCSTDPSDGDTIGVDTVGVPVRSFIPGCVTVDPMDTGLIWQPADPVPDYPETPYYFGCLKYRGFPGDDYDPDYFPSYSNWLAAYTQWSSDSANFEVPTPPELIDVSDLSDDDAATAEYWYSLDSDIYIGCVDPEIRNSDSIEVYEAGSCQFEKLYCIGDVSVKLAQEETDWFNPRVFPNPSNGGMTLTFNVNDRSFVQIGIYDMLGKEMNIVSSGYDDQGPQSLSLGTESLPSGNYVCRVRVGDRAAYINLVIKK